MQFTDGCVTALQRQLKDSIVFSAREMEFSLLYDGSFAVSWDIKEKGRKIDTESTVAGKRPGYINCQ